MGLFRKMSFNPDPSKQATEIVFSKKRSDIQLPTLRFNNNSLTPTNSHKHLGMIFDRNLNFKNYLSEKISKANKGIGIIRRLYKFLSQSLTCKYLQSFRQATFRLWCYNLRQFFKCYIFPNTIQR